MFNEKHLKAYLNKIKNSLYLGLIFVILYPEIINAAKIKNCSNCGDGTFISNNNENDKNSGDLLNDIACFLYHSNSPTCKVKRLTDAAICENVISWNKNKVISEQLYLSSKKEQKKRKITCSESNVKFLKAKNNIKTNNSKANFSKCSPKKDAYKHNCWGILRFSSGNIYKGFFKNNTYHGKGFFIFASTGNYYEGNFKDGKYDGFGKWIFGEKSKSFGSS